MTSANHDPAAEDRHSSDAGTDADDTTARRTDEPLAQPQPREESPPQRRPEHADEPRKASRSGGLWAALIIGTIILILLLIFIVQNNVPADFNYMAWQFQLPLGVAMLFAAIAGALIAVMVGSVRMMVLGRRVRRLERQRREMRKTLDS